MTENTLEKTIGPEKTVTVETTDEKAQDKSADKSSHLTFVQRKGIIDSTIGRIGAIPTNIILGTPISGMRSVSEETVEQLKERYKDVDWRGQIEVQVNHARTFHNLKRLFEKERRANIFGRILLGIPTTINGALLGKFFRANHYNPFTETVHVYHTNKAVGMHELGHAEDFDKFDFPTLRALLYAIPGLRSKLEWNASHNAMKRLKSDDERDSARKVLEPAFGTHIGADTSLLTYPPAAPYFILGGALAGHINARTSEKNIFYSNKSDLPARFEAAL